MQTCILTLGILFASQIGQPGTERYRSVTPPASTEARDAATTPFSRNPQKQPEPDRNVTADPPTNPLRSSATPSSTPPAASSTPPARLTKVIKPADLLKSLAKPVGQQQLVGTPISLAEAVQNSRSRGEQTRRVNLYWQLSEEVTNYQLTALEELQLKSQRSGLAATSPAWDAAQLAVAARKQVAFNAVKAAQLRFQKVLGRTGESKLPLPSDLPHCGAYETKHELIFRGRTSREAALLAELLPLRHKELAQRASEATAAREWYILVNQRRSPQGDTTLLLKAFEQLVLQRKAFIETAYQYNTNIARYTELAVPQDVGTVRLVAMLIQSDHSVGDWQPGSVQRASAEEAVRRQGSSSRSQPRTYAEGGRSETRRVPNGNTKGEHSIIVDPNNASE